MLFPISLFVFGACILLCGETGLAGMAPNEQRKNFVHDERVTAMGSTIRVWYVRGKAIQYSTPTPPQDSPHKPLLLLGTPCPETWVHDFYF